MNWCLRRRSSRCGRSCHEDGQSKKKKRKLPQWAYEELKSTAKRVREEDEERENKRTHKDEPEVKLRFLAVAHVGTAESPAGVRTPTRPSPAGDVCLELVTLHGALRVAERVSSHVADDA